jgi:hypothetical protein
VVGGYLITPEYEILLGDLQSGVVRATVTRGIGTISFRFEPVSADQDLPIRVRVWTKQGLIEKQTNGPTGTLLFDLPE